MSGTTNIYSPLPQSISDSDSEKELQMDTVCTSSELASGNTFNTKFYPQSIQFPKFPRRIIPGKKMKSKMSPLRKTIFAFSILMCFLPVIVVLWILPCDIDTCPVKVTNWEQVQEEIEMKGPVNLIENHAKNSFNLAFMYKARINSSENSKHGVISFVGSNGNVLWRIEQDIEPREMKCDLIDIDGDNLKDCLLLDDKGLKGVHGLTGQILWHVYSHEEQTALSDMEFPVLLQDVNNDDVPDLVSVYRGKSLLIICGKTGKALKKIPIDNCMKAAGLNLVSQFMRFDCDTSLSYDVKISDVVKKYYDDNYKIDYIRLLYKIPKRLPSIVNDRELIINNTGVCPDCQTSILIADKLNNTINLRELSYKNAFTMQPMSFSIKDTGDLSAFKGHLNGYVIKIWHYYDNSRKTVAYGSFSVNSIFENVLVITFNATSYNLIKPTLTNITQLCFANDMDSCQPNQANQGQSLLSTDLDGDGMHEIVSFCATYYNDGPMKGKENSLEFWKLKTSVKVVRLEDELLSYNKPN